MNCDRMQPLLGGWLAGEIRPEERAAAELHLLDCAACRVDFELAQIGMRAAWPDEPAPKTLRMEIPAPRIVSFLKFGTAAALLLAVLAPAGRSARPRPEPLLASFSDGTLGAILVRDEEGKPQGDLRLQEHRVSVEILDGVALTTVEETFENRSDRRLEGTFRFPLPQDAAISRLALEVNGKMEEGTCLERERAREVFESIVRRQKDPALLEWLPGGIFQCRIFPIEPRSTKRVIVGYTQVLPFSKGRLRYQYPLASEKTREFPPELLSIDVRARFSGSLSALTSPTHRLAVQRRDVHEASGSFRASRLRPKDDFVVELETADDEVRVVAHQEDGEDGYVAVFVAPRVVEARTPRRYALLIDASASVTAPAFAAAGKVVDALRAATIPGDRVDVAWFNVGVERAPVQPLGGCDLLKALQSVEADETILIGECTPTLGETDRTAIVEAMKGRRIRTIAIGSQIELGLIEKLGPVAVIAPGEDVVRRAAELASTLGAPVVRNLRIAGPVAEVVGGREVFAGDRVLLAARYQGSGARLTVFADGWRREVEAPLPLKEPGNTWVKRVWAQRKVADLLAAGGARAQVVALGVKHQIMTPYTSFLVLETEQMWKDFQLERTLGKREELLGKGRTLPEQQKIYESRQHYDLALRHHGRGEFEKAKIEAQKAVQDFHENLQARKLLDDINQMTTGGRAESGARRVIDEAARDDFKVRIDQAQLEITKHVRDGERYLNAHMPEKAIQEFEDADFKIRNIPYDVQAMNNLLPLVGESIVKAKNARTLENWRQRESRRSESESEAVALPRRPPEFWEFSEGERASVWNRGADRLHLFDKSDGGRYADHPRELVAPTAGGGSPLFSDVLSVARYAGPSRASYEQLARNLAELEEKHVDMARDKKFLEEKINAINMAGGNTNVAPRKPLEAKVTAVANEIGLVVISIGKDAGVLEGDEFTVFRGGDFVAKIVVDRADRQWAAGKIVLKKTEPRVADDASNHVFLAAPRGSERKVLQVTPEGVVVFERPVGVGERVVAVRDGRYVAMLRVLESGTRGRAEPWLGIPAAAVQVGDRIETLRTSDDCRKWLPSIVWNDLASRAAAQALRVRLEGGR